MLLLLAAKSTYWIEKPQAHSEGYRERVGRRRLPMPLAATRITGSWLETGAGAPIMEGIARSVSETIAAWKGGLEPREGLLPEARALEDVV